MFSVFLSYGAEDAAFAERLASLITDRGAKVFTDVEAVSSGDHWKMSLRSALEQASALVLLLPSDDARNRNNLWFEAGAARTLGKRVLAVLPPGRHLSEVPRHVADVLILDADQRPLDGIADTLLHAVPDNTKEARQAAS